MDDSQQHSQSNQSVADRLTADHNEILQQQGNQERTANDVSKLQIRFEDWGFKVERLFEVAYRFYKRNESKAFHPSFDERNHMNALILQARYGNFNGSKVPDVGVLDLVGKRRRHEWSLLEGMSKKEAMSKFIYLLDDMCPLFKAHAEAVKISSNLNVSPSDEPLQSSQQISNAMESNEQLQTIYASLCRQTHDQFKSYAEKQFPNDLIQQKNSISTLQEQYYQQYISNMHPELAIASKSKSQTSPASQPSPTETSTSNYNNKSTGNPNSHDNGNHINNNGSDNQFNNNEDNDVQADISSEEINYEDLVTNLIKPNNMNAQDKSCQQEEFSEIYLNQTDVQEHTQPTVNEDDNLFNEQDSETYIETVRLYQNIEPQIGPFESFPEPTPIRNPPHQQPKTSIATLDPNLPKNNNTASISLDHNETSQPAEIHADYNLQLQQQEEIVDSNVSIPAVDPDFQTQNHLDQQQQSASNESPTQGLWNYSPPPPPQQPSCSQQQEVIPNQEPLEEATTWSRRGVAEFKDSLANDKHGGIYEVKQGTQVFIQVPTYPDGRYIYFEFATDDYDIGFGLDFIYETDLIQPLALNIYEESFDDEDEDFGDCENWRDLELGSNDHALSHQSCDHRSIRRAEQARRLANTVQIIPTYRRESHEEVFAGRHRYPGCGYYLLKFDNTYSVMRSKSLYFRICYFV